MDEHLLDMSKIVVITDSNDWHGMTAERLWVSILEPSLGLVRNNPLYAYGISYGDVVKCGQREDGSFVYEGVAKRGGHSNYRVLLRAGKTKLDFLNFWPQLEQLGCSYESSADPEDVFAIDVPPDVDVHRAYSILMGGQDEGVWHVEEGNYEHGTDVTGSV